MFDPASPKGFYLNRGVFYFGRKVEGEMDHAEQASRKNRKPSDSTNNLANAARLRALEKNIGVPIKRHRDPGSVSNNDPFKQFGSSTETTKDESTVIMSGF